MATLTKTILSKATSSRQDAGDSIQSDSVLSSVCNDPVEYPNCLSNEIIESLQSVKHTSLGVLNVLLKQMAEHTTSRSRSSIDLIDSITQSTSLLFAPSMIRSYSSPTNMEDVQEILENHVGSDRDYTLCCSIAALLNNICQLLEINAISAQKHLWVGDKEEYVLQKQLQEQLFLFQSQKSKEKLSDTSQEMLVLWEEIGHLSDIVSKTIIVQELPPAYNDRLPEYNAIHTTTLIESNKDELDDLLSAIHQLSHIAPRFNNQRAVLPTMKVTKDNSNQILLDTVERLQSRRLDDQRVDLKQDRDILQHLIQQIQTSASRTFDNQRVQLKPAQSNLHTIIDRMQKRRYINQDALSYEEKLIQDLTHTTDLLVKSLYRPVYNRQRFELKIPEQVIDQDLELLFSFIHKSTKQLNNQRASFTL